MAEQHLALGVSCVKVKVGLDPETDIARVRAVREVSPHNIPLTIDANSGWTNQQAKNSLRQLADVRGAGSANLIVLFGHPRLAAELPAGIPVLVAWHRQRLMQEAVARWLGRRLSRRHFPAGVPPGSAEE